MQEKNRLEKSPCVHESANKHKRTNRQIAKTLVCLIMCMTLTFMYSFKTPQQEVHAVATGAVAVAVDVVGTVAIATALTMLGVGISAAMGDKQAQYFLQSIWDGLTQTAKDGIKAYKNAPPTLADASLISQSISLNYWTAQKASDAIYYTFSKQATTEIYNGFIAQRSKLDTTGSSGVVLPAGNAHPAQFSSYDDLTNFLGLSVCYNDTEYYSWVRSCTEFKVVAVRTMVTAENVTFGKYSVSWTQPVKDTNVTDRDIYVIKGVQIYKSGSMIRRLYDGTKIIPYEENTGTATGFYAIKFINSSASKFFYVTYMCGGCQYFNILEYDVQSNTSNNTDLRSVFNYCTDGNIGLPVAQNDVINVSNDGFYAKELSAINTTLQQILDKLYPDGATNVTARNRTGTAEGAREGSQTDAIGRTITDADAQARDKATNADTDTTTPKPIEVPDLSLPELITRKFPFCLPWDLYNAFVSLAATPAPPKYVIPVKMEHFGVNESITIDFAQFDTLAKILRWGLSVLFVIGLILITRKLIGAE